MFYGLTFFVRLIFVNIFSKIMTFSNLQFKVASLIWLLVIPKSNENDDCNEIRELEDDIQP